MGLQGKDYDAIIALYMTMLCACTSESTLLQTKLKAEDAFHNMHLVELAIAGVDCYMHTFTFTHAVHVTSLLHRTWQPAYKHSYSLAAKVWCNTCLLGKVYTCQS